jgi:hypothetical protein
LFEVPSVLPNGTAVLDGLAVGEGERILTGSRTRSKFRGGMLHSRLKGCARGQLVIEGGTWNHQSPRRSTNSNGGAREALMSKQHGCSDRTLDTQASVASLCAVTAVIHSRNCQQLPTQIYSRTPLQPRPRRSCASCLSSVCCKTRVVRAGCLSHQFMCGNAIESCRPHNWSYCSNLQTAECVWILPVGCHCSLERPAERLHCAG